MTTTDWPTTENIRDIFCEEIAALNGHVESVADDGRHLYCRATLPLTNEVAAGDRVRAGAALRATPACACICPWLLRILCINGIIVRQPMPEREVEIPLALPADVAEFTLREAIAAMCSEEAFADAVKMVRTARRRPAQLDMTPFRRHLQGDSDMRSQLLIEVMRRFRAEGDRSAFGLMNAVTSVARDTTDPETRWRLEELGGAIAAGLLPAPPTGDGLVAEMLRRELLTADLERRARVATRNVTAPEPPCQVHSLT